MDKELTLWDLLRETWAPHQLEALAEYMRLHGLDLHQALHRLATEGLAIDAMCPEISEKSP